MLLQIMSKEGDLAAYIKSKGKSLIPENDVMLKFV